MKLKITDEGNLVLIPTGVGDEILIARLVKLVELGGSVTVSHAGMPDLVGTFPGPAVVINQENVDRVTSFLNKDQG